MALAILVHEGPSPGPGEPRERFRFEIGTNRYWSFAVGEGVATSAGGLRVLADPRHTSPVAGPLTPSALGRGFLDVPRRLFDRRFRHIQLASFRDERRAGPAVSNVLKVPLAHLARPGDGDALPPPALPAPALPARALAFGADSGRRSRRAGTNGSTPSRTEAMDDAPLTVGTTPFRCREEGVSSAMFLGTLVSMLPKILPAVAPLLGGLLGAKAGAGAGGAAGTGDAAKAPGPGTAANPDTMKLLVELLQQLAAGGAKVEAKALARAQGADYSEAKVAPALLAALPALMPLLQQVLTPETIKGVLDKIPNLGDVLKLGIESHEQDLRHLRELNPGVDDPALDKLLMSMGLDLDKAPREPDYKRVSKVELRFEGIAPQTLFGRQKVLYRTGRRLAFPMAVTTPRPIHQALFRLEVKRAKDLEVIVHKRQRLEQVESGPLGVVPFLDASEAAALAAGQEYLVKATLLWKTKDGGRRGQSLTQLVTMIGEHAFDRVEDGGEPVPLNDVAEHRDFWHKVWQGTFEAEFKSIELDLKYYWALEPERDVNARMETVTDLGRTGLKRWGGKLKSGMALSPAALNRLLPRISPHAPLGEAELEALRAPDFVERFDQAARYKARLRGARGDSAALWVWPEMRVQRVVLQRAAAVDGNGHVTGLAEHTVHFPMPALVHFVGASTQS